MHMQRTPAGPPAPAPRPCDPLPRHAGAQGGGVRETRIKLRHGDTLTVSTVAGSVSIGFLRRFLGGGFQVGRARAHERAAPCTGGRGNGGGRSGRWHAHALWPAGGKGRDRRAGKPPASRTAAPPSNFNLPPPPPSPTTHRRQAHLQSNPLLHAVFDYEPLSERPGRLTALEKRQLRSPSSAASKQQAQARRGQRAHKGGWGGDE